MCEPAAQGSRPPGPQRDDTESGEPRPLPSVAADAAQHAADLLRAAAGSLAEALASLTPADAHLPPALQLPDPERLRPCAEALLAAWYAIEDLRLHAAEDPLAPAPGAAALTGAWLGPRRLRLLLPEHPPRYPVALTGQAGLAALARAKARWRDLVGAALHCAGGSRPRFARAAVHLRFHHSRGSPPDPDSYAIRFIANALVEAGVLADDGPRHIARHTWRVRVSAEGALGTEVLVVGLRPPTGAVQPPASPTPDHPTGTHRP